MKHLDTVIAKINASSRFLITATASADGDSIGSQLALHRILRQLKGNDAVIDIVNEHACPDRYAFLPDSELIQPYSSFRKGGSDYDIGFVLDGGSERSGKIRNDFNNIACRVLVDHHKYGSHAEYEFSLNDPEASSTAEIVFRLYEKVKSHVTLDKEIAAQLYLAVVFDTGNFRFPLTTPKTMMMGAQLIATGIDFTRISDMALYETSLAAKHMLGNILYELELEDKGRVSWTVVTRKLEKHVSAQEGDHERVINHILNIDTVEVAILLYELKNAWKVSFRSKGSVDVGKLARSIAVEGGGHARAAGCTLRDMTLQEACELVLNAVSGALQHPEQVRLK